MSSSQLQRLLVSPNPRLSPLPRSPLAGDLRAWSLRRSPAASLRFRSLCSTSRIVSHSVLTAIDSVAAPLTEAEMERFVLVANQMADAAGEVIRKYFRQSFEVIDKHDLNFNVAVAGDRRLHKQALDVLQWQ